MFVSQYSIGKLSSLSSLTAVKVPKIARFSKVLKRNQQNTKRISNSDYFTCNFICVCTGRRRSQSGQCSVHCARLQLHLAKASLLVYYAIRKCRTKRVDLCFLQRTLGDIHCSFFLVRYSQCAYR